LVLTPIVVDWHAFFFDIWTIPAGHPWKGQITGGALERLHVLFSASNVFFRSYWLLYLLLIAIVLGLNVCSKQSGDKSLRFAFTLTASALIAAFVMLPFSLIGWVKVGGSVNNFAYPLQPILFGLVIGGLALFEIARRAGLQWNVAAQSLICACLVAFIVALRPGKEILRYPLNVSALPLVTAYNESKTGNVWFPEFPLSTLLATGRLYHHSFSVYAIFLAGKTVPAEQIAEGIPKAPFTLKFLAGNPQGTQAEKMISYLKLHRGSLLQRRVGPWQEVLVQLNDNQSTSHDTMQASMRPRAEHQARAVAHTKWLAVTGNERPHHLALNSPIRSGMNAIIQILPPMNRAGAKRKSKDYNEGN